MKAYPLTEDVFWKRILMVNVVYLGTPGAKSGEWALVDTGLPLSAKTIERDAKRLGYQGKPCAILLTHGHFDHVGAVVELSQKWDVPVYIPEAELPYVMGKATYPPPDPFAERGLVAKSSAFFPRGPVNLGDRAVSLPSDGRVPSMSEWQWVATPGHTAGHASFFRERDRTLIAGDCDCKSRIAMERIDAKWDDTRSACLFYGGLGPCV